jgi:meso-butanediol dehydrogenase / (S,S)-butanediol dehydrogenase / diacetyl reductase
MPGLLEGKVALITGTGGGQGRAAAVAFAAEGARVIGCDVKTDGNKETVRLVQDAGGEMTGMEPIDLADADEAKRWVDEAAAVHDGFDILYNNASATRFGFLGQIPLDDWHFTIRNELDIVFFTTQFAWSHLVDRGGGVILNTGSIAGMVGAPTPMSAHAAAKGAVIAFTRQAAVEGAAVGIRCVCISPGPIETPGTAEQFAVPEIRQAIEGATLVGRVGQPDDIAKLAVYLVSDQASFVTGANFVVDGGQTVI